MNYYMAIDIGASSGRHIVGCIDGGRLSLTEVYRFPNGMTERDGRRTWDVEALFAHVVEGLRRAGEMGLAPSYLGIDTWGVDYVLTDGEGRAIGEVFGYRDERTKRGAERTLSEISFEELYSRTGIQMLEYNTVYQLMADKTERPEVLERAEHLLMIPDYLGYRLTGVIHQEYTNATTGALVNLDTGEFDLELIERLGYPKRLFGELSMPGEAVGGLLPEIRDAVGYDLTVLHTASHDTASAVVAVPMETDRSAYISSGTWSLLGTELCLPNRSDEARRAGFTHEGGYGRRYRFLTNIMGLWIIQSIRSELGGEMGFGELSAMARSVGDARIRINVNDPSLMAPKSMISALAALIGEQLPTERLLSVVYHSLADYYAASISDLEGLVGGLDALHIIGGGSRDEYLNELTAARLGIPVYAGPVEATAIGNILVQMISAGEVESIAGARRLVKESFNIKSISKCK